jgi:hypothetical protein
VDDIVKRAMHKWPDVPRVFGWMRLDARGDWLLRTAPGVFDAVRNPALIEFIGRNYECDQHGRWYFQNGPQRVFVSLDCTPFVYRLDDDRCGWRAHTGAAAGAPRELLLDEQDRLIMVAAPGPGVVLDRDLGFLLDNLRDAAGAGLDSEQLFEVADRGGSVHIPGGSVKTGRIQQSELARRFGFVPDPEKGQEECQ